MTPEQITLAARVLAWADGMDAAGVAAAATEVLWLDAAQQALEDIKAATA